MFYNVFERGFDHVFEEISDISEEIIRIRSKHEAKSRWRKPNNGRRLGEARMTDNFVTNNSAWWNSPLLHRGFVLEIGLKWYIQTIAPPCPKP